MSMQRTWLLLPTAIWTIGCQGYKATPVSEVAPQTVVRVFLNDAGRKAVEAQIGPQIDYLEGNVVARDSATLKLDARLIKRLSTPEEKYSVGRPVELSVSGIGGTALPQTSKGRSTLLGGAILAGTVLVGTAIGVTNGSSGRGNPGRTGSGR